VSGLDFRDVAQRLRHAAALVALRHYDAYLVGHCLTAVGLHDEEYFFIVSQKLPPRRKPPLAALGKWDVIAAFRQAAAAADRYAARPLEPADVGEVVQGELQW
jgi:hypothetical protein